MRLTTKSILVLSSVLIVGLAIVYAIWLYSSILGIITLIFFITFFLSLYDSINSAPLILSMEVIDQMNGHDFEKCIGYIYQIFGYRVQYTPKSRDNGADLIISKSGDRIAVQTKRYAQKVSNKAIQEAVASKAFYNCNKCMVVTNNFFTTPAMKLAKANNVILVNRSQLKKLIREVSRISSDIDTKPPSQKEDLLNRGADHSDSGDYKKALECYNKALEIDPDCAFALINMGTVFTKLEDYERALEAYEKATKTNPGSVELWNNKGNAFRMLNRYNEALEAYKRAVQIDPYIAETWVNMGVLFENLGDYEMALKSYNQAIKLSPNFEVAWQCKNSLLENLKGNDFLQEEVLEYEYEREY